MSALRASVAIRRGYHRALTTMPLKSTVREVPAASALTVLGAALVDGRTVAFATGADTPRLWGAVGRNHSHGFGHDRVPEPHVVGHLTGLVRGRPDLWVCDFEAWDWISTGAVTTQIKAAAARVWFDCERTCDG